LQVADLARAERLASHAAMARVAANGLVDERDSHRLAHHPFVPGSSAASFRFKHEAAFPRKPHEQHKFIEETKYVHELLFGVFSVSYIWLLTTSCFRRLRRLF